MDAVKLVLALEAVSERLGTKRSGVFELEIGGTEAGADMAWIDPTEDMDARDEAEAIASALIVSHSSTDCLRTVGCSREVDLRSCEVKLRARGLRDIPGDFPGPSFMDDVDGEVTSFLPSGFEKLHFFEGVLWLVGVVTLRDCRLDGVLNTGTSSGAERTVELSACLP